MSKDIYSTGMKSEKWTRKGEEETKTNCRKISE
jgi:hypothetical protein